MLIASLSLKDLASLSNSPKAVSLILKPYRARIPAGSNVYRTIFCSFAMEVPLLAHVLGFLMSSQTKLISLACFTKVFNMSDYRVWVAIGIFRGDLI